MAKDTLISESNATIRVTGEGRGSDASASEGKVAQEAPGRYAIRDEMGHGGMGRVLLAFDEHLGREVAFKEMLGPDDAEMCKRFLREARVTGQLEHPNIVPVYEVGRSTQGRLYYTMRLVRGKTLADAIAECRTLDDRLRLLGSFWDLCNGVSFAHAHGVVHRDLKPENVMVGEFGETVLLDWGLAKLADHSSTTTLEQLGDAPEPTAAGAPMGTPAYMSPEQASGDAADQRSDVWGLGAVLYELLTGAPPFDAPSVTETLKMAVNDDVVPVRKKCPRAPPELAAIAAKALRRSPDERYQSASEMVADVKAFMTGGRVRAHVYTPGELLRRLISQNKALAAGIGVAATALVLALVVVAHSWEKERAQRQRVQEAQLDSELSLAQSFEVRAERAYDDAEYDTALRLAAESLAHNPAHPKGGSFSADFGRTHPQALELRLDAASMLYRAQHRRGARLERILPAPEPLESVACSPDGTLIAAGGETDGVYVWDRASGRLLHTLEDLHDGGHALAFAPDGTLAAAARSAPHLALWDARTGALKKLLDAPPAGVDQIAFSPDLTRLAGAGPDPGVRLWDIAAGGGPVTALHHVGDAFSVSFFPDGRSFASAGEDGLVRRWSFPDGRPLESLDPKAGLLNAVAVAPDGRMLAIGGRERAIRLISPEDGHLERLMLGHRDTILQVVYSPDGKMLASIGRDDTRLWNSQSGVAVMAIGGSLVHRDAAFSSDGKMLAVASDPGALLYALGGESAHAMLVADGWPFRDIAISPDGKLMAASTVGPKTHVWDLGRHRLVASLPGPREGSGSVAFSPDGGRLAVCGEDGTLRVWDLERAALLYAIDAGETCWGLAFDPDGRILATGGTSKQLRLRDAATGRVLSAIPGHEGTIRGLAFSPDGARLASTSEDKMVRLWDVPGRKLDRVLGGHRDWSWGLSFSKDGKLLATCGKDGVAVLWDVAAGSELRRFEGHGQWVTGVRLSPDGKLLATCGEDRTTRLWDAQTGALLLRLRTPRPPSAVALSPDSQSLIVEEATALEVLPIDTSVLEVDPAAVLSQESGPGASR